MTRLVPSLAASRNLSGRILLVQVYALTSSQLLHETLDLFQTREAAEAELHEILEDEPEWVNVLRVVRVAVPRDTDVVLARPRVVGDDEQSDRPLGRSLHRPSVCLCIERLRPAGRLY